MPFLTGGPIDPQALAQDLAAPARGAEVLFIGTVRDHHGGRAVVELEYSAYGPMAERECTRIMEEARNRWPVEIALRHRVGRLAIGDVAVVVVAAGGHRDEAFAACRYVIEETKRRVPIWKRERYAGGEEAWVDPTAAEELRTSP